MVGGGEKKEGRADWREEMGGDERGVLGGDERDVVGGDEKDVLGEDERDVLGDDERDVLGDGEKDILRVDETDKPLVVEACMLNFKSLSLSLNKQPGTHFVDAPGVSRCQLRAMLFIDGMLQRVSHDAWCSSPTGSFVASVES